MDEMTILAHPGASHQWEHGLALMKGLKAHGIRATMPGDRSGNLKSKHVACWGWRLGQRYRERGHEVLVMERGYLGDRFRWTSLGWNGLNGRAIFPEVFDFSRFLKIIPRGLTPWKAGGEYALLIGQVPGDASLQGNDLRQWYDDTSSDAGSLYGLPVRFRAHPQALERGYKFKVRGATSIGGSLADALAGAAVVITYNSNVGVDAAIAGCPVIAFEEGAMAYEVAGHVLGERITPQRDRWAARLSWCQWTMAEIESGEAWEKVGRCAPSVMPEAA